MFSAIKNNSILHIAPTVRAIVNALNEGRSPGQLIKYTTVKSQMSKRGVFLLIEGDFLPFGSSEIELTVVQPIPGSVLNGVDIIKIPK
jgi:uncharacterized protein involved in high-affinity Fe2+ transport